MQRNNRSRGQRNDPHKESNKRKICYFCSHGIKDIDYKDTEILKKFISNYMKILPRKRIGTCAKHQRKYAQAVKRARFMALMPFTNK